MGLIDTALRNQIADAITEIMDEEDRFFMGEIEEAKEMQSEDRRHNITYGKEFGEWA